MKCKIILLIILLTLFGLLGFAGCEPDVVPRGPVDSGVETSVDSGPCGIGYHIEIMYNLYCVPDQPVSGHPPGGPCADGYTAELPNDTRPTGWHYYLCTRTDS